MFAQESVMDIQEENNLIQEAFEVEADEVGFTCSISTNQHI